MQKNIPDQTMSAEQDKLGRQRKSHFPESSQETGKM